MQTILQMFWNRSMSAHLIFSALLAFQVIIFIDFLLLFHLSIFVCLILSFVQPSGAKEDDYVVDDEMNKIIVEESAKEVEETNAQGAAKAEEISDVNVKSAIGSISFVSCATGDESLQPTSLNEPEEGRFFQFESYYLILVFYVMFCFCFFQRVNQG